MLRDPYRRRPQAVFQSWRPMTENFWSRRAAELADAYVPEAGSVRFQVVTRALLMHMPPDPQRVVDVGGGYGLQAILLARAGHSVVVVDFDPRMLAIARDKLARETQEVASRVELVLGPGEKAASLVGRGFDLACCHSVLMYQAECGPLLSSVVDLVRGGGGLISVLCVNLESYAMRSGLQGRWREAAAILEGKPFEGKSFASRYAPSRPRTREEVAKILEADGVRIRSWQGIGVFTDHLTEKPVADDPREIYRAEWLASNRDPYRRIARCFHIIAERP